MVTINSFDLFIMQFTVDKVKFFFLPGPPDAPKLCSMINQTSDTVSLVCGPGYGGGLVQRLHMEVWVNILFKNSHFPLLFHFNQILRVLRF